MHPTPVYTDLLLSFSSDHLCCFFSLLTHYRSHVGAQQSLVETCCLSAQHGMLAASPSWHTIATESAVDSTWCLSLQPVVTRVDACALAAARLKAGPWQVLTGLLRVGQEMDLAPLIEPFQRIWARFSFRNYDIMRPTSSALIIYASVFWLLQCSTPKDAPRLAQWLPSHIHIDATVFIHNRAMNLWHVHPFYFHGLCITEALASLH